MEPALLAIFGSLDAAGLAALTRSNAHVYPLANVLHVLGAIMLVGAIGVIDARIVGLWHRLPLADLSRALTPIAGAGLALQAGSGIVLFAADGETLAASSIFHLKLILFAAALANAALFRWRGQRIAAAGLRVPSLTMRAMALLSLLLWIAIVVLGRLIAYY